MSANISYIQVALSHFGQTLKEARRRRRISTPVMAARLGISRVTLAKVERGDGSVSIKTYALALSVLSPPKLDAWTGIFSQDPLGQVVLEKSIPQRLHGPSKL